MSPRAFNTGQRVALFLRGKGRCAIRKRTMSVPIEPGAVWRAVLRRFDDAQIEEFVDLVIEYVGR